MVLNPNFIKKRVTEQLSYTSKKQQRKKKGEKEQSQHRKSVCPFSQIFYSTTLALQIKFFFQNFYPACLLKLNMAFPKPLFKAGLM